jgi:hypothetical protein
LDLHIWPDFLPALSLNKEENAMAANYNAIRSNQFSAGFWIADVEAATLTTIPTCCLLLNRFWSTPTVTQSAPRMCTKCH